MSKKQRVKFATYADADDALREHTRSFYTYWTSGTGDAYNYMSQKDWLAKRDALEKERRRLRPLRQQGNSALERVTNGR